MLMCGDRICCHLPQSCDQSCGYTHNPAITVLASLAVSLQVVCCLWVCSSPHVKGKGPCALYILVYSLGKV